MLVKAGLKVARLTDIEKARYAINRRIAVRLVNSTCGGEAFSFCMLPVQSDDSECRALFHFRSA